MALNFKTSSTLLCCKFKWNSSYTMKLGVSITVQFHIGSDMDDDHWLHQTCQPEQVLVTQPSIPSQDCKSSPHARRSWANSNQSCNVTFSRNLRQSCRLSASICFLCSRYLPSWLARLSARSGTPLTFGDHALKLNTP